MIRALDRFMDTHQAKRCELKVYVDDYMLMHTTRGCGFLDDKTMAALAATNNHALCREFENAGLAVADDKSKCMATSDKLGRLMVESTERKIEYVRQGVLVGVDCAGGKFIKYTKMVAMVANASRKIRKVDWIRKQGGKSLHAARLMAVGGMSYGARAIGVPDSIVRKTRTLVRSQAAKKKSGVPPPLKCCCRSKSTWTPSLRPIDIF